MHRFVCISYKALASSRTSSGIDRKKKKKRKKIFKTALYNPKLHNSVQYSITFLFSLAKKTKKQTKKTRKSMVNETLTKSLKSSVGIISII